MPKFTLSKEKKRILLIVGSVLILLLCSFASFVMNREVKKEEVCNLICSNVVKKQLLFDLDDDNTGCFRNYKTSEIIRIAEFRKLKDTLLFEEYGSVHFSMWDISSLDSEWYKSFFGGDILYPKYDFETVEELGELLNAALCSDNDLSFIYINVDPDLLIERGLREKGKNFEEVFYDEVISQISSNPSVSFDFFLPNWSSEYLSEFSTSRYEEVMNHWKSFVMYLDYCDNARVRFIGDEEWLVGNTTNYYDKKLLKKDLLEYVTLQLYAYEKYGISLGNFDLRKEKIDSLISKEGEIHHPVLEDNRKVVFLGDSTLDYIKQDSASVPGVVSMLSGYECYNLSIGGTMASSLDPYGFVKVSLALSMKSVIDFDSRYCSEAKRFLEDYREGDNTIFVVSYGFNDYFNENSVGLNDKQDKDKFFGALLEGVNVVKQSFPESDIILLSPYYTSINDGGKIPFGEKGDVLSEYVRAIDSVAKEEGCFYLDLYHDWIINSENSDEFLVDGVHLSMEGAYLLGEYLWQEMLKGKLTK